MRIRTQKMGQGSMWNHVSFRLVWILPMTGKYVERNSSRLTFFTITRQA